MVKDAIRVINRMREDKVTTKLELEGLANAVQAETEGVTAWVMPAEHLAAICLQTGRPKDYARLAAFIEQQALNMENSKTSSPAMDCQKHGNDSRTHLQDEAGKAKGSCAFEFH